MRELADSNSCRRRTVICDELQGAAELSERRLRISIGATHPCCPGPDIGHHSSMSKLRGGRGFGVALFFVVLAAGAAVLGAFLSRRGFDWAAKFSKIASFVLAGLAFLLPVAGRIVRWLPAPRIKDEQVEHDMADLAAALRAQGRFEGVQPGTNVYDRLPMPIRWEPAQEVMSGTWPGIPGFEAADPDETLAGT